MKQRLTYRGQQIKDGMKWGRWSYDENRLVLVYEPAEGQHRHYEIDLETCNRPEETLDWIAQIAGKTWADAWIVGSLVLALNDLLHLQNNIIHLNGDKRFSVDRYLRSGREVQLPYY